MNTEVVTKYKMGQTDSSGGRWGVAVKHAVKPGTERQTGRYSRSIRGTAMCGADVYAFQSVDFDSDHEYACKRCRKAVA